jgi:hypothetical protein
VRRLEGQRFDVTQANIMFEELFKTLTHEDAAIRVGPALAKFLIDRENDHLQDSQALIDAIKVGFPSDLRS